MRKLSKTLRVIGLATLVSGVFGAAPTYAKTFVYVSNAEDGNIDGYVMNMTNGALTSLGKTEAGNQVMPMAVSPNKQHLYAVIRSKPFTVVTYAIDPSSGSLTKKAAAPLPDSMPYVSTDVTGHYLFTSSYGGNKVAVSPISETGLVESAAIQVIPTGEKAHSIRTDLTNKFVFATNLGSDQILQFRLNAQTGQLTPNDPPLIKTPANNGPRHIILSSDNKYLYVSNELSGNIAQFALDATNGTLTEIAYTSSLPADSGLLPGFTSQALAAKAVPGYKPTEDDNKPRVWASDLQLTPNGKFIYALERTTSKISLLSVAPGTGKLTYVTNFPTEKQPRGFRIDPTGNYLVATGEKSDKLSVYKMNQTTGDLALLDRYPVGSDANWVEIVDLP
ncbi:MAG: beta-propeller fold lactonase family protein [Formivibrio sp.]|nr:beta-propeller fold lactonase family protein [Formivibrio sp.]